MKTRLQNPLEYMSKAIQGIVAVSAFAKQGNLPAKTTLLVHLRASQINGCSFCADMHAHELLAAGETQQRLNTVAAWREAPWFEDSERAALALTEAATRLADRADPVPDEIWDEAARYFDEKALSFLVLNIALINFYNRVNVALRIPAGAKLF